MSSDILLIRPPLTIERHDAKSLSFPLGLGYLASFIKKHWEVEALDCLAEGFEHEKAVSKEFLRYGLGPREVRERIKKIKPRIIGISCPFSVQFFDAWEVAQAVKEVSPAIQIVFGGAHPSAISREVLEKKEIDFVVIGEGEVAFSQLCMSLFENKPISAIDGIGFKEKGIIRINPKRTFIEDLNTIPPPARELFPMDIYFAINRPHGIMTSSPHNTNMITSRGCPFHCVFCSIHTVWGHQYRERSPENVWEEMNDLKEKYNIQEIQFEDDNLTFNNKRAKTLFNLMEEKKAHIKWSAPNGIALWTLDEELIQAMKKSGCYRVALGIESGDEHTLREIIHKPLNLGMATEKVKLLREYNIGTSAFFVVGFPQESEAQIKNSLWFASHLDVDNIHFYFPTPYPGTELYERCRAEGYLKEDYSFLELKVSTLNIENKNVGEKQMKVMLRNTLVSFWMRKLIAHPLRTLSFLIRRFLKERRRLLFYLEKLR